MIENIFNWIETAWNLIWGVGFVILILGLIYNVSKEFYSSSNIEKLKVIKITTFSILIIGIITFSYFYYQNRIFPFKKVIINCDMSGNVINNYKAIKNYPSITRIELPRQLKFSLSSFSNVDILYPEDFLAKDRSWNLNTPNHYYGIGDFKVYVPNTHHEIYGSDYINFDINYDNDGWETIVKNEKTYFRKKLIEPDRKRIVIAKYIRDFITYYAAEYACYIKND